MLGPLIGGVLANTAQAQEAAEAGGSHLSFT